MANLLQRIHVHFETGTFRSNYFALSDHNAQYCAVFLTAIIRIHLFDYKRTDKLVRLIQKMIFIS